MPGRRFASAKAGVAADLPSREINAPSHEISRFSLLSVLRHFFYRPTQEFDMTSEPRAGLLRALRLAALQALVVAAPAAIAAAPELRSEGGLLVLPNVKVEMAAQPVDGKPARGQRSGLKAYRDHQTGQLRKATPEELQEEAQTTPPDNNATAVTVTTSASGGKSAQLDESFMSYAVVRKDVSGKIDMQCVTGESQVKAALKGKVVAKEHRHAK